MCTSKYLNQAIDFCIKTGTEFSVEYIRTGKYFMNDNDSRDIYKITIKRGGRSYSTDFGQSVMHSGKHIVKYKGRHPFNDRKEAMKFCQSVDIPYVFIQENKDFAKPTAYDFFSTVQKYDPDTFENFCSEMGYNDQPLSSYHDVKSIYDAVKEEYQNIRMLYTDAEIEIMQEIQ